MTRSLIPSVLAVAAALVAAPLAAPRPLVAQQPTAAPPGAMTPLNSIVAVVGDTPITYYELRDNVLGKLQRGTVKPLTPADSVALERATLEEMVEEELVVQKAKALKIDVSDADVSPQVDDQIRQIRGTFPTESEFRDALVKAGLGTPEEYRKYLMDQYRRNALFQKTIDQLKQDGKILPVNVTDAQVDSEWQRAKDQVPPKPASVTFKQIVMAPQPSPSEKEVARVKAESLLTLLDKGEDFERLAKRESMDVTTKETGGDLGWIRRGSQVPEFERWVFGTPFQAPVQPGHLSPVFETPYGFHIIRVDRVQPGEVKVHQILIRPEIDSADLARTKQLADSVARVWRTGKTPFDSLAKKYNDYAGGEETSILEPFERDKLPAPYQEAFKGQAAGDIMVFKIPGAAQNPTVPKFVVSQLVTVDEGGQRTLADMKQYVRNDLAESGGMRRYIDQLKKQTYVSIRLDTTAVAAQPKP